jgi:hypothetical protein
MVISNWDLSQTSEVRFRGAHPRYFFSFGHGSHDFSQANHNRDLQHKYPGFSIYLTSLHCKLPTQRVQISLLDTAKAQMVQNSLQTQRKRKGRAQVAPTGEDLTESQISRPIGSI